MRIRVAQCLCPLRHAILAMALQDDSVAVADAIDMLKACVRAALAGQGETVGLAVSTMNPWCGLCYAPKGTWIYEVERSIEFDNWEQAQEALRRNEQDQLESAKLIRRIRRRSFNN